MEHKDELDRSQVAKLLGVGVEMVRKLQRDGRLKALGKRDGRVVYGRADIEALAQNRSERKRAASARREAARVGLDAAFELEFMRRLQEQAQREEDEAERAHEEEDARRQHDALQRQLASIQRELHASRSRPTQRFDITESVLPLAVLGAIVWLAKDQQPSQPPMSSEREGRWEADAVVDAMYAQLAHNDQAGK
jgi:hypothetical protein